LAYNQKKSRVEDCKEVERECEEVKEECAEVEALRKEVFVCCN